MNKTGTVFILVHSVFLFSLGLKSYTNLNSQRGRLQFNMDFVIQWRNSQACLQNTVIWGGERILHSNFCTVTNKQSYL